MDLRRSPSRRVVVTGLGALSAAGLTKEALWESLLAGRSGIGPVTRFDASGMSSRIAGEVKDFDPAKVIDLALKPRRMSRQTQLGVVAAMQAIEDARLNAAFLKQQTVATIIGAATSSCEMVSETALLVEKHGPLHASRQLVGSCIPQATSSSVNKLFDAKQSLALGVSSACAAGLDAIGKAFQMVRSGHVDLALCGGADAPISRTPMAEFAACGMLSTHNHEPLRGGRPFDRERSGGVIAEGAAVLVLESLESARARDADCYLEIVGYDTCMDYADDLPGSGLESTMLGAMHNGSCSFETVDYISAWGPGDPVFDHCETRAIKKVFGQRAYQIAVSSIKGTIGNSLGAAGALQAVALAISYRHRMIPPTCNWEHSDIFCDLDYVRDVPRRAHVRHALINAHGIGGGNSSLLVANPPPQHRT